MEQKFITELTNNDISLLIKDKDVYILLKKEPPKNEISIQNVCATIHWRAVVQFGKTGISDIYPVIDKINLRISYNELDEGGNELSIDNEIEVDNLIELIPNIETSDMQPSQHGLYVNNIDIYKDKICVQ
jgi:hypothetical protein